MSDLEAQLRGAGEVVAEGTFKVDAQRALKKLREHRLADPHHWVLEILRAAALSKPKRVTVRIDADDVELHFDGKPFPRALMHDLLAQSLGSGDGAEEQRGRLLSLGVAGALSLEPKWIVVESGGVKLEIRAGDRLQTGGSAALGTRIHVRKSLGWNVLSALVKKSPEQAAILDRARWFGCPLYVNKKGVDRPFGLAEHSALATRRYDGGDLQVRLAWARSQNRHHQLTLVSQGVIITRRELEAPGLPCEVLVQCESLRRNASGSDVVDADPATQKVLEKVKALLLQLTADVVERVQQGGVSPGVRDDLADLLLHGGQHPELLAILDKAPVVPGPSGEWYAVADFRRELKANRPIRYSLEPAPDGSYPTPAVLLAGLEGDWRLPLLPAPPTVDIKEHVEKQTRAKSNKDRWRRQPVEAASVLGQSGVARAAVQAPGLTGEVVLLESGSGAFVRFLCQGRFVQQGEVHSLGPLRLRATVDWHKDVPEALWAEMPTRKLFSLAAKAIEEAAARALSQVLLTGQRDAVLLAHATDFFERHARLERGAAPLPGWLASAPIFLCQDGSRVSLSALRGEPRWLYTPSFAHHGLMSGERLLVPDEVQRGILAAFGKDKLVDVTARLDKEREIRRRLAAPKLPAVLTGVVAVAPLENARFQGEAGVPEKRTTQLSLRLQKGGIPIETTQLSALYGLAAAVVDCEAFAPDADWEKVKRDQVFDAALKAVRTAEAKLPRLLVRKQGQRWQDLAEGAQAFLLAYLLKEADFSAAGVFTPVTRAVVEAKLFTTSRGQRSLEELKAEVDQQGALYVRPLAESPVADELFVVLAGDELAEALGKLFSRRPERPDEELVRRRALKRFLSAAVRKPVLEASPRPKCEIDADGVRGEVGLGVQDAAGAQLELLVQGRPWRQEYTAAHLPLQGCLALEGVDPLTAVVPSSVLPHVLEAVRSAEKKLVHLALRTLLDGHARRLLLWALSTHYEQTDKENGRALLETPLFPCTDGEVRSAKMLASALPVQTVSEPLKGAPASGRPVVVAVDPMVQRALAHFPGREDVTASLSRELDARARRAALKPRERILCEGELLLRRAFSVGGLEGEVALAVDHPRRLELLVERKPFCTLEGELPAPLCAAVNNDALRPGADGVSVRRDAAFRSVVELVLTEAELLAADAVRELEGAPPARQAALRRPLLELAVWGSEREVIADRLLGLPLLETTTGAPLALSKLLPRNRGQQAVRFSSARIAPLDPERWVWCPRPGEQELLAPLNLKLADYSDELLHAEQVRARPKVQSLQVAGFRAWVEPVAGKLAEGEVALRDTFEPLLTVDVLYERAHLELWSSRHPVGGVALVNCDALTPTVQWKKAVRNRAFRTLVEEVEEALERLVARRLAEGPRDLAHRALALGALSWSRPPEGPLARVLPGLELFKDLKGEPVTLGAVLEEQSKRRRVAVAKAGLQAGEGLVLADSELARVALGKLKVEVEDVSAILERKQLLDESRRARRLSKLGVDGEMLVRVPIDAEGVRGELSLPFDHQPSPQLTLAKEAIAVCSWPLDSGLPVVGVVDCPWLEVNDDWTRARPDAKLKALLEERVEALYLALAKNAERAEPNVRAAMRERALQLWEARGLKYAAGLEQLTGAALALTRAPLFKTTAGEWVTLAALADQVARGEKVGMLAGRWAPLSLLGSAGLFTPDVGDALVLEVDDLGEVWAARLREVLGPASVDRITDLEAWRRDRAEADPKQGTPAHKGLSRLRRQLKLLRAGALGKLTPDELEDVRLSTAKLKRRVEYDAKRKVLLLDGNDPQVVRALEEAALRPERLFVLLAASYGEINRALHRITDHHEADLLMSLAVHLASNPSHLSPAPAAEEKEA